MCPSSPKMHMAIHANTHFLFTQLDKEHLSTLWFSGTTLHWTTWSVNVVHCSCLKKEIPAHKSHANRLRSPPTHFLNLVQNFKYLIFPHFCQRILSMEIKYMISNIIQKDSRLQNALL